MSRVTGTVQFADPNKKITVDTANTGMATIDITRMEAGAKIYVAYRKVDVNPVLADNQSFTVTAASTGTEARAADDNNLADVDEGGPHVRTTAGSGEIKLTDGSDDIVPRGSKPNLVFSYKAATKLADVTIIIAQPVVETDGWQGLTLQKTDPRRIITLPSAVAAMSH